MMQTMNSIWKGITQPSSSCSLYRNANKLTSSIFQPVHQTDCVSRGCPNEGNHLFSTKTLEQINASRLGFCQNKPKYFISKLSTQRLPQKTCLCHHSVMGNAPTAFLLSSHHHYPEKDCLVSTVGEINGSPLLQHKNKYYYSKFTSRRHRHLLCTEIPLPPHNNLLGRLPCYPNGFLNNVACLHGTAQKFDSLLTSDGASSGTGMGLTDLVLDILAETERVDVMAGSIQHSQVDHLVKKLQCLGFHTDSTKALLVGKLWLLQQPEATLTLCRLLFDHGMTPHLICRVVDKIPHAHQRAIETVLDKINDTLLFFRNFGFSDNRLYTILNKDASVLFIDESTIRLSIARVKGFFPAADTMKVVCRSPNVLYDDWASIQAKFDYCIFIMGYIQSDIVKSHLFSHSLHHIQDRHIFLQRAGVFQVVNRKLHPALNPNPPLKHVVDCSDKSFVQLVDGVSVQDYRIYNDMREIEREAEEFNDDDYDDDEGDEDG